jgi:hypothetical protein
MAKQKFKKFKKEDLKNNIKKNDNIFAELNKNENDDLGIEFDDISQELNNEQN